MDSNKELIIFRIIQEAFNNVIKHAHATAVELQLDYTQTNYRFSLQTMGADLNQTEIKVADKQV